MMMLQTSQSKIKNIGVSSTFKEKYISVWVDPLQFYIITIITIKIYVKKSKKIPRKLTEKQENWFSNEKKSETNLHYDIKKDNL